MKFALAGWALVAVPAMYPVAAQSLTAPSEWSFNTSQGGFCVEYLVEPTMAAKLAPKEAVLTAAGRGEGLAPSVTRQVLDEPEFSRWIPASLCIGLYRSVSIDGKVVSQTKGDQPVLVLTHTLAASSFRGAPVGAVLIGFLTDNSSLERTGARYGQSLDRVTRVVTEREGAAFPSWLLSFKGMKLRWQGGPTGDPRVLPTRNVSFGYMGERGNQWTGVMQVTNPEARTLIGSMVIEGKNDLAKALLASPIRTVGAMESGGTARIAFSQPVRK